ncbi:hypothetical protein [Vagococcus hydrophili]|uniref:Uncharacterized protein n=1 Tax=Vagococcus hydrophili TaxID=2714947 RepID=A0A6G8AVW6_9ENTE|nr:hypothetical protein [Vagococcus hydrophili]QIL49231.1 hypothetical protein G7082_12380 [Vagococcus hydrophili]
MKRFISLLFKLGLVFLLCYVFLTPEGSVRLGVLRSGDIKDALTADVSKLSEEKNHSVYQINKTIEDKEGTLGYWKTQNKSVVYWSTSLDGI